MAYMRGEWDEALAIADYTRRGPAAHPTGDARVRSRLAVAAGRGDVARR